MLLQHCRVFFSRDTVPRRGPSGTVGGRRDIKNRSVGTGCVGRRTADVDCFTFILRTVSGSSREPCALYNLTAGSFRVHCFRLSFCVLWFVLIFVLQIYTILMLGVFFFFFLCCSLRGGKPRQWFLFSCFKFYSSLFVLSCVLLSANNLCTKLGAFMLLCMSRFSIKQKEIIFCPDAPNCVLINI